MLRMNAVWSWCIPEHVTSVINQASTPGFNSGFKLASNTLKDMASGANWRPFFFALNEDLP